MNNPAKEELKAVEISEKEEGHLDSENWECVVCHELLYQPIVTECGHCYCKACLTSVLKHAQGPPTVTAKCPMCRACLRAINPKDLVVCSQLQTLLQACFPKEYSARRKQLQEIDSEKQEQAVRSETEETVLPLFVLDACLPRQRLTLNVYEPRYLDLVRRCRRFGMVGPSPSGRYVGPARHGTEVEVIECVPIGRSRLHVMVIGRRPFKVQGDAWQTELGLHMANVQFQSLADQPETITETTMSLTRELEPLWEQWYDLVRVGGWERFPRHMATVLNELGPMPGERSPTDRAFWLAAAINPLPGLGVAPEIRPSILSATTPEARVQIAGTGLKDSIIYLDKAEKSKLRRLVRWLVALLERNSFVRGAAPFFALAVVAGLCSKFG